MKVGDIVLISKDCVVKYCIILRIVDNKYDIMMLDGNNCFYNVRIEELEPTHKTTTVLKNAYETINLQIEELRSKLKSIKRSDFSDEIKTKYYSLKNQINSTAEHMINSSNDTDFENKLKAICDLKKQFYTIECDGMKDARKFNGNILYQIKQIEKKRRMVEYYLQDRYITNKFANFDISKLKECR